MGLEMLVLPDDMVSHRRREDLSRLKASFEVSLGTGGFEHQMEENQQWKKFYIEILEIKH
jgi:hypothetical protein